MFVFKKLQKKSLFAFNIAVKLEKKAVKRNYLKRLMRQVVQKNIGKIQEGSNVFLQAQVKTKGQTSKEKVKEIELLLKKAGLFKV